MKKRKILPASVVLAKIRYKKLQHDAIEYLETIAWLYAERIHDGKRIKDFGDLTFAVINEELKLRTIIIRNETNRRIHIREQKQKEKQKALLERLKNIPI